MESVARLPLCRVALAWVLFANCPPISDECVCTVNVFSTNDRARRLMQDGTSGQIVLSRKNLDAIYSLIESALQDNLSGTRF